MSAILRQLNDEIASVIERAGRGLVQISSNGRGVGAGTIWHPKGLIVTNAHVVAKGSLLITLADGTTLPAHLLARDTKRDLAALAVDATGLPTSEVGNSKDLQPGQWVLALGHPWGVTGSAVAGVVIGTGPQEWGPSQSHQDWIVANLPLRPGHSGGPLLDAQGHLVGINTLVSGPDIGMAVPVHVAKAFLRQALVQERALVV